MPFRSASEEDPLLPRTEAAPEIFSGQQSTTSDSAEVRYSSYGSSHDEANGLNSTYSYPRDGNEIRNHGSRSDSSGVKYDSHSYGGLHSEDDDYSRLQRNGHRAEAGGSGTSASPSATTRAMSTIVSLFTMVVFFAVVAMTLKGGEMGDGPGSPVPVPSHGHQTSSSTAQPTSEPKKSIEQRVHAILTSTPLLDGHNDLAIFIRGTYANNITSHKFREDFEKGPMAGNVDLPRLRQGMVGGGFWSAFVACPVPSYRSKDDNAENVLLGENKANEVGKNWQFLDEDYSVPVSHTLQQIDLLKRIQRQYPDDFTPATHETTTRETMLGAWRASHGRALFGPLSIEGLHQLSPSSPLAGLRMLYDLGVRAATLTWNCHNAFADAALVWNGFDKPMEVVDTKYVRGGLTPRGREVVREMNRLGMLVDISHTSYHTQLAVLGKKKDADKKRREDGEEFEGASIAPVIFSHSSAYALCPHPRNVRDDVLRQVQRTGSLVLVNFSPDFISCVPHASSSSSSFSSSSSSYSSTSPPLLHRSDGGEIKLPDFYAPNNTLHQVARHITYIGRRIGWEYVGLGSDFDGMSDNPPRGLDGVDKYPDLVAELLRMGVTDEQAKAVVGGNLLRVWEQVDQVSKEMKNSGVQEGVDETIGW